MPISIDWGTRVIHVPQSYLTPMGGSVYQLDMDQFRLDLKDLEDGEEGMAFPDTHRHNTEVMLSGVTYSRFVEVINGYTVEFESGAYTVVCVGANHNLADVKIVNPVSLIIGNSGGLITVVSGSGVTEQDKLDIADRVWDEPQAAHTGPGSLAEALASLRKFLNNKQQIEFIGGIWYLVTYDDDDSVLVKSPITDYEGNAIQPAEGVPHRRGKGV